MPQNNNRQIISTEENESFFSFPHPVNEYSARTVAGITMLIAGLAVYFDLPLLLWFLFYEFTARVLTGPKLSIVGSLTTKVLVPRLIKKDKPVPGPPKQFAQTIGMFITLAALALMYLLNLTSAAYILISIIVIFAALESILGFCAGCFVFGYLMKWGLIPESTCERCANLVLPNSSLNS